YKESGDPDEKPPEELKKMIEKGELGIKSGKGFYKWR
ncbi:MAG: 3-hydroxyacyl-CoA dehydrogenase family protein, partial [Promethearchaeota archaeon]